MYVKAHPRYELSDGQVEKDAFGVSHLLLRYRHLELLALENPQP